MLTRIRDVRRARGLTLEAVAAACDPPTTAQTIGRLETGTRTVSLKWLNRIADALGIAAAELVETPGQAAVAVVATIGPDGARAPERPLRFVPPATSGDLVGIRVTGSVGEYRSGDEIWLSRMDGAVLVKTLNRDVVVPRPGGRFAFGRLIAVEGDVASILPPEPGARVTTVTAPPWAAVAVRLVRRL